MPGDPQRTLSERSPTLIDHQRTLDDLSEREPRRPRSWTGSRGAAGARTAVCGRPAACSRPHGSAPCLVPSALYPVAGGVRAHLGVRACGAGGWCSGAAVFGSVRRVAYGGMVRCECEVEGRSLRATPRRESGCASCPRGLSPVRRFPFYPITPHPSPPHSIPSHPALQRYPEIPLRFVPRDVPRCVSNRDLPRDRDLDLYQEI
ncbi:hypothetical protein AcV7_004824 [Taiwanofungus camphoratus]|nr:hypothetical protein AcV7_004824 [Antrodia cinnamomea]